jgi:rhodanese-related sulfurtransferase
MTATLPPFGGLLALCLALVTTATAPSARAADTADDLFDPADIKVRITEDLPSVLVRHEGQPVLLMRHQDPSHSIAAPYDKTARPCPPFCIQPMQMPGGVETIAELELIGYLSRVAAGDEGVLVIDSRTPEWTAQGTIPGSRSIPYTRLDPAHASPAAVAELLELEFGASRRDGLWSFGGAKTLVLFCNGPWCGQSPTNIKALLDLGYPARKLKWYRGGLQTWESLGLTTVRPAVAPGQGAAGEGAGH